MCDLKLSKSSSRIIGYGNIVMIIGPVNTYINHDSPPCTRDRAIRIVVTDVETMSDTVDGLIWVVTNNIL